MSDISTAVSSMPPGHYVHISECNARVNVSEAKRFIDFMKQIFI